MKSKLLFLLSSIVIFLSLSSCRTTQLVYIQDRSVVFSEDEKDSLYLTSPTDYLLQPDDYLYIKIFSPDKIVESEVNPQGVLSNSNTGSQRQDYLNSYAISASGYVDIPLIGKIHIAGKTVKQGEAILQKKVDEFLVDARAVLKLLSFKVTFLGEVGKEGVSYFYQRDLNLLEAFASVGGIADYGKRNNILILRQEDKGYRSMRVDLTDRSILTDPKFYLKPNDIVYVEPTKSKQFRTSLSDYALIIGTITSTISTLLLIISLSK